MSRTTSLGHESQTVSGPAMGPAGRGGKRPREITGRRVLFMLLAFFGVVIGVNLIMARYAVTTFSGLETESSYKAGLAFKGEERAAEQQAARQWEVDIHLGSLGGGGRSIEVRAVDKAGASLSNLVATARLEHPTDARRDVVLDLEPVGNGQYRANTEAPSGQWDLIIDFAQSGERVFRSRNRVQLP